MTMYGPIRATLLVAACALYFVGHSARISAAESQPHAASATPVRIVAYIMSWTTPPDIHPEKLTHINFAFGRIDRDGKVVLPHPGVAAQLAQLRALKTRNPGLKIIISVGGWTAEGFSDAASSTASRNVFANSAVALLREHELDGIDLDWEYPGQSVAGIKSRPGDKHNFTLLLKTLREQLDRASAEDGRTAGNHYLLTIASADREYFDYTEMEKLHVYLDWLNVMTYDFFNSLTPTTGHHAGLYRSPFAAPTDRNADASVKQHLAAGIPADKLVLGVAFYGRGFAGVSPLHRGLNQPYERFEAAHPYAELVDKLIGKQGFVREWDAQAKAPFLWNATTHAFITYDDPESIAIKADYVKSHHLGGMMFWELSQDHQGELLDTIAGALSRAAADQPVVVPITLLGNFPVVSVQIAGTDVPLIFDSGNSGTVALTQAVIDRVKAVPTGETSRGMDPKGNVIEYPKFKIPRVQIGTAVFTDVVGELDVHDPSYQATQVGQQGFLGTSLLKPYKVVLDYPHRRITLVPAGSTTSAGCKGTAVPFSPAWHGEPATEVDTDLGKFVVWWDTGTPTSVLSKKAAEQARPSLAEDSVTSKRLALGDADFGPWQFVVSEMALPPGFDGLIGYDFFAHHVVCMDFPAARLLIQP
ncbi:MAG TPA: glycosyl hydrolase family 18 protein [Steroidobacteraceae bacterium]|nr:glycosyl hydrolase family 18 protein [Steroidobacteraceae bacterium]